eukprot:TRINITY_DN2017_c0_g1_i2.p1 TRINITY_DN2017_c0_g1~~TRINITY_DN2017_c0_g1_i2.p1  ORF type:complete len:398 (+),score=85.05 TRINITY_DN2017_c0_g1_i2:175-1368(+)
MNATEMQAFLEENHVPHLLTLMVEAICDEQPADCVTFMIEYLQKVRERRDGTNSTANGSSAGQGASQRSNKEQRAGLVSDGQLVSIIDEDKSEQLRRRYSTVDRRRAVSSEVYSAKDTQSHTQRSHANRAPQSPELRERIERCLTGNILFASLERRALEIVCDQMFELQLEAGATIIRQYDEADNFYVIDSGICNVFVQHGEDADPEKVATLGPGASFGELALMYGTPRAATVQAATDVTVWALDREAYRQVLLKQTLTKRRQYEDFLRKVPILASLTDYERLTIADALQPCEFKDGEVIVTEGTPGSSFYMIMEGNVKVTQSRNGTTVDLSTLHANDFFGEVALIMNQPRVATVTAVGPTHCVKLDRDSFTRLLGPLDEILKRNMKSYGSYIKDLI